MHKKTKIILATAASIELVIFAVMVLVITLDKYSIDEWLYGMGAVGLSGILYAARTELQILKTR